MLKIARSYLYSSGQTPECDVRTESRRDGRTDRRTDRENRSGYYSGLHCEQYRTDINSPEFPHNFSAVALVTLTQDKRRLQSLALLWGRRSNTNTTAAGTSLACCTLLTTCSDEHKTNNNLMLITVTRVGLYNTRIDRLGDEVKALLNRQIYLCQSPATS